MKPQREDFDLWADSTKHPIHSSVSLWEWWDDKEKEIAWLGWQAGNEGKAELLVGLAQLLKHVDRETCTHEETYRGGAIWTICRQCDRKWADDRGGFQPHEDAPAVAAARALLKKHEQEN